MNSQQFLSPADVLIRWAKRQMDETRQSLASFSEVLTDEYMRIVPEERRTAPLDEIPVDGSSHDFFRIRTKNAIADERWIKGAVKVPLEVLDAWVFALVGEYREGCLLQLMGRFGLVPVPANPQADAATYAKTLRSQADLIDALVDILADGVVDRHDTPVSRRAMDHIASLEAQTAGWKRLFSEVLLAANDSDATGAAASVNEALAPIGAR
jgi:hypothetical protein